MRRLFFALAPSLASAKGHRLFIGDNPPFGASIDFHIGAGGSGAARLVITNAVGDAVRTMTAPWGVGLHRVYWDLRAVRGATPVQPSPLNSEVRSDRPGENPPAGGRGGGFGTSVEPGTDVVTLIANGVTSRRTLTVERAP